ncbi:MAG: sulfatase-like hydrolase/transferase, partial [bacterium]|nr:sulfatase-like hydrolase/transferase [bacterium]
RHWDYAPPPPYDTRFVDSAYAGPVDGSVRSLLRFYQGNVRMPEADRQQAIGLYDGEIAYLDAQIGRLLEALRSAGQFEDTVVVLTADHGEEFKEHGQLGHARTLFGEQLRVPLVIAGDPRLAPQQRLADLVSPVDIMPTLLEMAGATAPAGLQGRSLLHLAQERQRAVWAESIRFGQEMRAARMGDFKMIHHLQGDNRLFFDLVRDPGERRALTRDPTGGRLTSLLDAYAARADSGWHLKLISVLPGQTLRLNGTIRTDGRLVKPRRYFSANVSGSSKVEFEKFEVSADQRSLSFEVNVTVMVGEVVFETDPPDTPVTFEISVSGTAPGAGVFLGRGGAIDSGKSLTLKPTDPRLQGVPDAYASARAGCYIRAVIPPSAGAPATQLTPEAIERLKSLGYIDT